MSQRPSLRSEASTSRTVNRGRQAAARLLHFVPALPGDCRGRPCGKPLRASRKAGPRSTAWKCDVWEPLRRRGEPSTTPGRDHIHLPGRSSAVARTIRKHAVGILVYRGTWMANGSADGRALRARLMVRGESADDLYAARRRFPTATDRQLQRPVSGRLCGSGHPCGRAGHQGRDFATGRQAASAQAAPALWSSTSAW